MIAGTAAPPMAATAGATTRRGSRSSPRTISRLISSPTRKKNIVDDNTEGTRKSFDGKVPESTTYEEWLDRQPESVQIEALGRSKWELWSKGKLNFRQLVDQSGNPLSTEALIEKYS